MYLDNGATTQKPLRVIQSISEYYLHDNANIHRGVHTLSRRATEHFEAARQTVADHFNLENSQQLIFTAGTTDSINMVAQGLAKGYLQPGDEIILSAYEHHSNILPWQLWAKENGGHLKVIPLNEDLTLNTEALSSLVGPKTRLIAVAHVSNTLGLISDIAHISSLAKHHQIPLLIDGAQSAPHMQVDLKKLQPDFFVCSAHKMYGPTGIGVLILSERWLQELPLSKTGGGTIKTVSFDNTVYAEGALRLEPGTPHIAGAIGFAEAIRFMKEIGMENVFHHEESLTTLTHQVLKELPEVIVYGPETNKAGVVSFNIRQQHPFDVGTLLDKYGIAVRTGHHCTQPLMEHLGIQGTVRVSFGIYNTREEIIFFAEKLKKVISMLA